jgi:hypothetical protein
MSTKSTVLILGASRGLGLGVNGHVQIRGDLQPIVFSAVLAIDVRQC